MNDEPAAGADQPDDAPSTEREDRTREFSPEQRTAVAARQADYDRTLTTVHDLEAALAAAAPHREGPWRSEVQAALDALAAATADEERNATQPDSLLSDIARTQPRLRNRVRGLRAQYRNARETIDALRQELATTGPELDVADLRQRLAWMLTALRHQRARESDLIYEAYYEAFNRDIEQDLRTSGP